jgi:DNA-binding LacI/PurR family transcriptional regulator
VGDHRAEEGRHSFSGRIFRGISDEAEALGLETVMAGHFHGDFPLLVRRGQVDGAVCMLGDTDIAKLPAAGPVPCVSLFYDLPGADLVTVDNTAGARAVGRYLCRQGHRRIAFIGPDTELARERLAGLRQAAGECGAEVPDDLVAIRPYAVHVGTTRELMERLVDGAPVTFTALMAYNDYMAAVAIQWLREKGKRVPADISVAGYDGALPDALGGPRITTAAIPLEQVGAAAIRLLSWRIHNPGAVRRRVVLEPEFVAGETVGPLRMSAE